MNKVHFDFFEKIMNHINIEVLEHGLVTCDTTWNYKNFTSPFSRLYILLEGEGILENSKHQVILKPGHMYLIPLNSTYNYVCNHYMKQLYLHFRLELFFGQDIFEQLDSCLSIPVQQELVDKALEKITSNNLWDILYFKALLLEICSNFMPLIPNKLDTQINNAFKYREVFRYVKENCSSDLTLSQVSNHVNMSVSNLSKSFKTDIGYTLKSYIEKLILQTAKQKILLSGLSIKEIAFELKFSDEFYFSKFFKKHAGVSPREYRTKNKF